MKKSTIMICIVLAIVAELAVSWKYITPARNVLQICSVKVEDVDSITLLNGRNGHKANIADKDKIRRILDILKSPKYKYLNSESRNGFTLSIEIFKKDKRIARMIFSSDEVVSLKKGRYKKTSGGFDINKVLKYAK